MEDEARALEPEQQQEQQQEQDVDTLEPEQEQEQQQEPDPLVKKLRNEAAGNRVKAREAGELAEQRAAALFTALVKLDGRLADPSDLPFSEEYLTDEAALGSAISDLLERKPGLSARQYLGDIGAGVKGGNSSTLIELMRGD